MTRKFAAPGARPARAGAVRSSSRKSSPAARTTRPAAGRTPMARLPRPATRHSDPSRAGRTLSSGGASTVLSPVVALAPDLSTAAGLAVPARMAPRFPEDDYDYSYIREFLAQPFVPGSCRAVVFACGRGEEAVHLSERGYRVTGLDSDRNAVGLARERAWLNNREVDFMIGDVFESANLLPAESFGLASDRGVFRAIAKAGSDDRDRRRFLELVRRLLLPGGVFLLNAAEVDTSRRNSPAKTSGSKRRGARKVAGDLLVQQGGEVMGEVLRSGLEIVGRKLYSPPANGGIPGDASGSAPANATTPARASIPAEDRSDLLLYCRR